MKKDEKATTIFAPTKIGRFTQHVLEKMFEAVGRVWSPEITGTPGWFMKTSWTTEQAESFRDWMVKEGMRRMRWRKSRALKEAQWFLFDCGWTTDRKESAEDETNVKHGQQKTGTASKAPRKNPKRTRSRTTK